MATASVAVAGLAAGTVGEVGSVTGARDVAVVPDGALESASWTTEVDAVGAGIACVNDDGIAAADEVADPTRDDDIDQPLAHHVPCPRQQLETSPSTAASAQNNDA